MNKENTCIFCKIVSGELPSRKVYEDGRTVVFRDTNPQAPVHLLVIPRDHVEALDDEGVLGHLLRIASHVARQEGLAESGYRTVINTGPNAGQTVSHIHVHVLGGRALTWPPG